MSISSVSLHPERYNNIEETDKTELFFYFSRLEKKTCREKALVTSYNGFDIVSTKTGMGSVCFIETKCSRTPR